MATLVEPADMETLGGQTHVVASPTSTGPSQRFNDGKFYLLVVIGETTSEEQLKCAIADIERGETKSRGAGRRGGGGGGRRRSELGRATWQQMRVQVRPLHPPLCSSLGGAGGCRCLLLLLLLLFLSWLVLISRVEAQEFLLFFYCCATALRASSPSL